MNQRPQELHLGTRPRRIAGSPGTPLSPLDRAHAAPGFKARPWFGSRPTVRPRLGFANSGGDRVFVDESAEEVA